MLTNRSMPSSTVIPVLGYADVDQAAAWLCDAFGFTERLRIANHRVQLNVGDGAVVVAERPVGQGDQPAPTASRPSWEHVTHSIMVRVPDVDRHYARSRARSARILEGPADYPYGERQYSAEDPGGHRWTFSQSIADVDPATWGGILVTARSDS